MTTTTASNIVPKVTCFDVRAALNVSPRGTSVCIDFSTLIGRLMFHSPGNDCTCDIARFPIPTLEPSFDDKRICSDPILKVVTYRLRDFSTDVVVDVDRSCTTCTFRYVKHVDSLLIRELLCEQSDRVQFDADCIAGTFTVRVYNVDKTAPVLTTVDKESVKQLYEVTRRFLRKRRNKKKNAVVVKPSINCKTKRHKQKNTRPST